MSLTYVQQETAVTGASSSTLDAKVKTAIARFCYNVYTEGDAADLHSTRVYWVRQNFRIAVISHSYLPQVSPTVFRSVLQGATNDGLTGSSTDADVQTFVDTMLDAMAGTGI